MAKEGTRYGIAIIDSTTIFIIRNIATKQVIILIITQVQVTNLKGQVSAMIAALEIVCDLNRYVDLGTPSHKTP